MKENTIEGTIRKKIPTLKAYSHISAGSQANPEIHEKGRFLQNVNARMSPLGTDRLNSNFQKGLSSGVQRERCKHIFSEKYDQQDVCIHCTALGQKLATLKATEEGATAMRTAQAWDRCTLRGLTVVIHKQNILQIAWKQLFVSAFKR